MKVRHGYLEAVSTTGTTVSAIVNGTFDLAILVGSWDRRCLCITSAGTIHVRNAILLSFKGHDPQGIQYQNEQVIREHFLKSGTAVHDVDGLSEDVQLEWPRLWSKVKELYTGRPLRCLLDLTTCPRYYSLGLIAGLLSIGMVFELTTLYAEGEYHPASAALHPIDIAFSIGRWDNVPIPFLQGRLEPSLSRYYLVSVGFEGTKTARILARDDPDRISVLYPIPGVKPEYESEVIERNAAAIERFQVPESQILRVAAGDSVGVWEALRNAGLERFEMEDVYYLCCGTKAHSLGMALRALESGRATVLYNVPERHSFIDVSPVGVYWATRIRDLSSPAPLV